MYGFRGALSKSVSVKIRRLGHVLVYKVTIYMSMLSPVLAKLKPAA